MLYLEGSPQSLWEKCTTCTLKHGGGFLMFWGYMSYKSTGIFIKIDDNLHSSVWKLRLSRPSNVTMIQNTRPNQPFTGQRRRTKKWRFWSGHDNLLTSISLSFSGEISDVHFMQDYPRRIQWLYVFIIQEEWTTLPSRKMKVLITDAKGRNH